MKLSLDISNANTYQAAAEKTLSTTAINKTEIAIKVLPVGKAKDDLLLRLQKAKESTYQKLIDNASKTVATAESRKTMSAVTTAEKAVSMLDNGDVKTALNSRLESLTELIEPNANNSVTIAEQALTAATYTAATKAVLALNSGDLKTSLSAQGKSDDY